MKLNKKMGIYEDGIPKLRIFHRKQKGKKSARYLIKCGDCDKKIEIYYGNDNLLEINGVISSKKEWKKILIPLLKTK